MANMRAQLVGMKAAAYGPKVTGGGGPAPAPLNLGPLDESDALFARLHSWITLFAEELNTPATQIPAWRNFKEVQGSKPVSVEAATFAAAAQTRWLLNRIDQILRTVHASLFYRDMVEGLDADTRGVFSLAAQYGVKARPTPQADMRECPECENWTVFLKLPNAFDADFAVLCGRCGWTADAAFHAKHTGRTGYAAFASPRAGICAVCCERYVAGTLINRIEDMTMHDGCTGIVETPEQREEHRVNREVGHPKAVVVHVGQPRPVLAGVALVDPPSDIQRERSHVLVRGRAGVRNGSRESHGVKFAAKYSGQCAGGCDGIEPGDEVEFVDDVLMHTDCENSEGLRAESPDRKTETCPECWVIKPCGCGEF